MYPNPTHDGKDLFTNHKEGTGNLFFRWYLLWIVPLLVAPYPFWLSFINCSLSYEITIILNAVLLLNFTYAAALCWQYMWRMLRCFNTSYLSMLDIGEKDKITHVIVLPIFKEPVEVILNTIDSIAAQTIACSLVVVVGMEEKTPDQENKRAVIERQFGMKFKALVFSVHPYGIKGEIPGACSNRNYASRAAVKYMIEEKLLKVDDVTNEVDLNHTTLTVCDADTKFFPKYFENLTYKFLSETEDKRHEVCWQSPLFYNISLDKRWFFTRVIGILRSFFMVGFLIGCDINTMSIYSVSLRLLVRSKFFHPWYHMDDIIFNNLAMLSINKRVRIRCLDVPTLSGPTSGVTFFEELKEWAIQGTRWTTGAAEVFHYLCVKLFKRKFFFPGFSYMLLFAYYYGFVLCVSGIVQISTVITQLISIGVPSIGIEQCQPFSSWFGHHDFLYYGWILPAFLLSSYCIVFCTAFLMDALIRQTVALEEHVHPLRNLIHLLSCQIVLWGYCLLEYKTIFSVAIYGKQVCGHRAAEKHALAESTTIEMEEVKVPEAVKREEESTLTDVVVAVNVQSLANGREGVNGTASSNFSIGHQ